MKGLPRLKRRPRCDELCIRYTKKECITEREDELCDQTDMYMEVGDFSDRLRETYEPRT